MRWDQGRATIDAMLRSQELEHVKASREWADQLMDLANEQIAAAEYVLAVSPLTSFQTSYDAVHKIFDAILVNQGLRGTQHGGHIALQEAMKAQLVPPLGAVVSVFAKMRKLRNAGDYFVPEKPVATKADAVDALKLAKDLAEKTPGLLDNMSVYGK